MKETIFLIIIFSIPIVFILYVIALDEFVELKVEERYLIEEKERLEAKLESYK